MLVNVYSEVAFIVMQLNVLNIWCCILLRFVFLLRMLWP